MTLSQLSVICEHLSDESPLMPFCSPATYNFIISFTRNRRYPNTSIIASALGRLEEERGKLFFAQPCMEVCITLSYQLCQKLKELGCLFMKPRDDYGKHNIPDEEVITAFGAYISESPLKGKFILVTGEHSSPSGWDPQINKPFYGSIGWSHC